MSHHEHRPPSPRHEADIKRVKPFVFIMLVTLVLVTLCSLGLWLGFQALQETQPQSPFEDVGMPASQPQLQANPVKDLASLNQEMSERLHGAGWVSQESGVVHMPIDRAMTLLAERGLKEDSP